MKNIIQEKVQDNYRDFPLSERTEIVEIELEDDIQEKVKLFAEMYSITPEEFLFMVLIDKIDEIDSSDDLEVYATEKLNKKVVVDVDYIEDDNN